jgi:hypothetical protein
MKKAASSVYAPKGHWEYAISALQQLDLETLTKQFLSSPQNLP